MCLYCGLQPLLTSQTTEFLNAEGGRNVTHVSNIYNELYLLKNIQSTAAFGTNCTGKRLFNCILNATDMF